MIEHDCIWWEYCALGAGQVDRRVWPRVVSGGAAVVNSQSPANTGTRGAECRHRQRQQQGSQQWSASLQTRFREQSVQRVMNCAEMSWFEVSGLKEKTTGSGVEHRLAQSGPWHPVTVRGDQSSGWWWSYRSSNNDQWAHSGHQDGVSPCHLWDQKTNPAEPAQPTQCPRQHGGARHTSHQQKHKPWQKGELSEWATLGAEF